MFSGSKAIPIAVFSIVSVLGCAKLEPLTTRAEVEPPERVGLVDLPVLQLEERQKKPRPEKLYTLSVRSASIQDVLLSFSRESKENIVVDPDVQGKVTVDLKDVTLTQALNALLLPLNLDYHMQSGFIRVAKPKKITRIFHLDYVITSRSGSRGLTSNIASTTTTGGTTGGTTGTTGTTGGAGSQGSSVSGSDFQDIFLELEYGLAALGLQSQGQVAGGVGGAGGRGGVGGAIGAARQTATAGGEGGGRGTFSINRQAGIILINSYPEILAKAAEFIEAVEGTIQRQVLIQAKIVEITLDNEFNYGIDWDLVFNLRNDKQVKKDDFPVTSQNSFVAGGTFAAAIAAGAGEFSQFTMRTGAINLVMDALSKQGDVNVISSPKISTLNNQTAIIRATTQQTFFSTDTKFVETSPGEKTAETSVSKDVRDIGVTLDVTPQISASGMIIMNIHPAITDLVRTEEFKTGASGEEQTSATAPVLSIRETDTVVRVRDGETIVIGGLMKDKVTVTEKRFPLLWRIPGVGKIFTSRDKKTEKIDLVIFLTPTILLGDRVEDHAIEEMKRLEMVRRY